MKLLGEKVVLCLCMTKLLFFLPSSRMFVLALKFPDERYFDVEKGCPPPPPLSADDNAKFPLGGWGVEVSLFPPSLSLSQCLRIDNPLSKNCYFNDSSPPRKPLSNISLEIC